jgi:hypothetical protein
MLLILLISLLFATDLERSNPKQSDLNFCRGQVTFVPFIVHELSIPDGFPEHFEQAMHTLWVFLSASVKVRDADINRKPLSPNLTLLIRSTEEENTIAAAETLRRDRCGRPDKGRIFYNINNFDRTKEEIISDLFHELIHMMGGFSSEHQSYYYIFGKPNDNGEEGLINGHIKQKGKTFFAVSPGVLEEVHKIDPKLIGAAMACRKENGVRYPAGHWHHDKFRHQIGCDLMLPHADHEGGLSPVTVAMINDFGWYEIDYEKLSHLLEPSFQELAKLKADKMKWHHKITKYFF